MSLPIRIKRIEQALGLSRSEEPSKEDLDAIQILVSPFWNPEVKRQMTGSEIKALWVRKYRFVPREQLLEQNRLLIQSRLRHYR